MRCSISECREEAIGTVRISFRETRNLCKRHYELFAAKDLPHKASFKRASDI